MKRCGARACRPERRVFQDREPWAAWSHFPPGSQRSAAHPTITPMGGSRGSYVKTTPWHSKLETDRKVYHNETRCTEGNNIEDRNRQSGTGGRPLCEHCAKL